MFKPAGSGNIAQEKTNKAECGVFNNWLSVKDVEREMNPLSQKTLTKKKPKKKIRR